MTNRIVAVLLSLSLAACMSPPPRRDFTPGERIQTIAVTDHSYLFAQKDVLLEGKSLDKQLSAMNPSYQQRISKANTYENLAVAAFIAQIVALGICFGQDNLANTLAWCGGSVGIAFALGWPFSKKAMSNRTSVVQDYNQNLK